MQQSTYRQIAQDYLSYHKLSNIKIRQIQILDTLLQKQSSQFIILRRRCSFSYENIYKIYKKCGLKKQSMISSQKRFKIKQSSSDVSQDQLFDKYSYQGLKKIRKQIENCNVDSFLQEQYQIALHKGQDGKNRSIEDPFQQMLKLEFMQQICFSLEQKHPKFSIQQNGGLILQQIELSLKYGDLSVAQLEKILKSLLGIPHKNQKVKELINIALRRPQGKISKHLEKAAINDVNQASKSLHNLQSKNYCYTQQHFEQENKSDLEKFKEILKGFEMNDYSYLYKLQDEVELFAGKVLDYNNWSFVRPVYEPYFERFLDLMKVKIEFVSESRFIYPALYRIKIRMEDAIQYKGQRRKINGIDEHLTDLLFQHYMQQLQTRSSRSGVYCVRDPKNDQRVPLAEFIADCPEYLEGIGSWRDIFAAIGRHFYVRDSSYDPKRDEAIKLFIGQIPNISLPAYNCLGCTQFFFVNHNIYQPQVCKHALALLGSISQITVNSSLVKDEIVALLNGKGGVLLFDCSKTYNSVIPRGTYFIQKEKKEIQQKITDYLEGIYPKPQIHHNIFISWVPIKQDPFQQKQLPKAEDYKLNYIEGLYVCRITVKPTYGHIVYYWIQQQRPIFSLRTKSLFPDGKRQLSGREINKFIKQKFNNHIYQFKDYDQFERMLMGPKQSNDSCLSHNCRQPEMGIPVFQKKNEVNTVTENAEQIYKYASVAVAKKQDVETIKEKLRKYGVECVIKTPFVTLKLKGAANSAIIYHNTRFEQLLSIVSNNKDFEFGGRYLLIISITDYVKLTERNQRNIMSQADFKSLQVWLNRQYPNETLKMWKFITDDNDQEFYIQTGSKESSLYIYIVMTQFLQRSSFKNPKGLQRMDQEEKQARFKLYYPLNT